MRGIPATLYVSYNEADRADSINVDVFRPLLSIPPLSNYLEVTNNIVVTFLLRILNVVSFHRTTNR